MIGLLGTPLAPHDPAWMDGLLGFVQVDDAGQPAAFPDETPAPVDSPEWLQLRERLRKLLRIR